jgi:hypothetical protein
MAHKRTGYGHMENMSIISDFIDIKYKRVDNVDTICEHVHNQAFLDTL